MTIKLYEKDLEFNMNGVFEKIMQTSSLNRKTIEREVTCYVKVRSIGDIIAISDSNETHEQWRIRVESENANMRIRCTDDVEYTLTVKEQTNNKFASIETEQVLTRDMFEVIRTCFGFDGYNKHRYNINIPGSDRKWEVDMFRNEFGKVSPWVKLDYEFDEKEDELPEIPFEYLDIIIPAIDDGRLYVVDKLWSKEWVKIDVTER